MEKHPANIRISGHRRWLTLFASDRSGVSAVEFTLVFPILVALFAGTVDLGQALLVSRKMNQIVSSVGDIVSQKSNWTNADATALLKGAATVIQPYNVTDLSIHLIGLDVDAKLVATVNWSLAYNGTPYLKGKLSPKALPADMATANTQMVLVESKFSFTTPFSGLLSSITGMKKYSYDRYYFMRPRNSNTVTMN